MHQSLIFNFLVVAPPLSRRGAQKTCGLFLGSSLNTPPDRLIETAKPFFFVAGSFPLFVIFGRFLLKSFSNSSSNLASLS